ncbi:MAG TPA: glycosyltransferase family 2 protein [Gemmatimonadales bacterium]|nr:glycosyltransferase family 2 protein [Gemmatimonadales bacterium]
MSYQLSVVVPTYQRRTELERLLRALGQQTLAPDSYEVIVSIDGSNDGTRELLAGLGAPYHLQSLWHPNRGRAAACNAGIAAARGTLVLLLDDDMEPSPRLLEAHRRAHAAGPRLGVLGAVPIALGPSCPPVVEYIGRKFNQHLEMLSTPGYRLKLRDFFTGNFSIRRDLLLEVGGFDEGFTMYGNEDVELSLRLARAGVRVIYAPEASAQQHYTKTFAQLARDNIAKGQTAVLLATKHPECLPELKLSTYRRGSWKWRALRGMLLRASEWWPHTPEHVSRFMEWLQQRRGRNLPQYFTLSLDYFYWVGARIAGWERAERSPAGSDAGPELSAMGLASRRGPQ